MATYNELRGQIEKLQAQAEEMRLKEIKDSVASIKQKIAELGLTAADLGLVKTRGRRKGGPAPAKKKGAAKVKYRDPASGSTWTGRGRPPRWIADAEAKGKKRESFAIG